MPTIITRRNFMLGTAGLALQAAVSSRARASGTTRVVLIRDKEVWKDDSRLDAEIIQRMLDEAVTTLLDRADPIEAFKLLVRPDDVVGIKSNVWQFIPTPTELEKAIERRVMNAGVPKDKIAIDDRGVHGNPIFEQATALINARPLRTHFWSGIGGCIKNFIPFSTHPPDYHPDSCADLALLWNLPLVKGKTRLNVLSVLNPLFHGRGPHHFDRRYVWKYNGLIVGTDPVAVDAVGLELIHAKRLDRFGRKSALATSPKHVRVADERHGLGTADLSKIDLVKLGWKENILIG